MTDSAEYLPRAPFSFDKPGHGEFFTGDDLRTKIVELIAAHSDMRLNGALRAQAYEYISYLADAVQPGARLISVSATQQALPYVDYAAEASSNLALWHGEDDSWQIVVDMKRGTPQNPWVLSWDRHLDEILDSLAENGEPQLVVGNEGIRTWLQSHRPFMLRPDMARPASYVEEDVKFLAQLQRADGITLDELGYTMDEAGILFDGIFNYIANDSEFFYRNNAFLALELLTQSNTSDQKQELYLTVIERLASILPLNTASANETKAVMRIAADVGSQMEVAAMEYEEANAYGDGEPLEVFETSDSTPYSYTASRALMLAYWFSIRARLQQQSSEPNETAVPELAVEVAEPPEVRPLRIAAEGIHPSEAKADNAYVTQLRRAGVPASSLGLAYQDLRLVGQNLSGLMLSQADIGLSREVLANLEYLFHADYDAARPGFYDELLNKLARRLPITSNKVISVGWTPHLVASRVIAQHWPQGFVNNDGEQLHGDAAVATIMADMYTRKAEQFKQRNRYGAEGDLLTVDLGPTRTVDVLSLSAASIARRLWWRDMKQKYKFLGIIPWTREWWNRQTRMP